VTCEHLEPLIEAIADESHVPDAGITAHLASCPACAARVAAARAIENLLASREVAQPSAAFTAAVMARVGQERWKTERVVDLSFNLLMAAAVVIILAAAGGLAWSLGIVSIRIDLEAILNVLGSEVSGRVISQVQTFVMAAALLTMALVLWWWAEAATD
jgi:predicted anti-sigma-YlaC factor YlaD